MDELRVDFDDLTVFELKSDPSLTESLIQFRDRIINRLACPAIDPRLIGIVLILAPFIPVTLGVATMMFYRARVARQAAAIEKAKAAAVTNFLKNVLSSQPATAPRSNP